MYNIYIYTIQRNLTSRFSDINIFTTRKKVRNLVSLKVAVFLKNVFKFSLDMHARKLSFKMQSWKVIRKDFVQYLDIGKSIERIFFNYNYHTFLNKNFKNFTYTSSEKALKEFSDAVYVKFLKFFFNNVW